MTTLRRLYVYIVTIVALEVWLWSLASLLTSLFERSGVFSPEHVAGPLAGFLVGLPVFVLHWRWMLAEPVAEEAEEEAVLPWLRALALYTLLLLVWAPVLYAALRLANNVLSFLLQTPETLGGSVSLVWERPLAILLVHLAIGWYFNGVLQNEEARRSDRAFLTVQQVYRYGWLSAAALLLVLGAQQALEGVVPLWPQPTLDRTTLWVIHGVVDFLSGVVLWGFWGRRWWRTDLADPRRRFSWVVVGFLSAWLLAGLTVTLVVVGRYFRQEILMLLRAATSPHAGGASLAKYQLSALLHSGNATMAKRKIFTVGAPWALLWFGAARALRTYLAAWDEARRERVHQFLQSVLAAGGLAVSSSGVFALLVYFSRRWFAHAAHDATLASGLALLLIGLPLWLIPWRDLQAAAQRDPAARQSLIRRTHLYLVLLAALLGSMAFIGALLFQMFNALLGGRFHSNQFAFAVGSALWVLGVLGYHLRLLLADRRWEAEQEATRRRVVVWLLGSAAAAVVGKLGDLPVTGREVAPDAPPQDEPAPAAVVLSQDAWLALSPAWRTWLQGFSGAKIVLPPEQAGWLWLPGDGRPARQLRAAFKALSEGKTAPKPCQPSRLWQALGVLGLLSVLSWGLGVVLTVVQILAFALFGGD